jgi:hypothetical protein
MRHQCLYHGQSFDTCVSRPVEQQIGCRRGSVAVWGVLCTLFGM